MFHIDNTQSTDYIGLNFYGPENTKEYRCDLDVIDNFSKVGWTIPLNNKGAPKKETFLKTIISPQEENQN